MPVLKHAKKKMRQDKKRTLQNKRVKTVFKELLKKAKEKPTKESVSAAYSSLDKAAKNHIIHKNKAARLKSSLSKLLPKEEGATAKKVVTTKTSAKREKKTSAPKAKKASPAKSKK